MVTSRTYSRYRFVIGGLILWAHFGGGLSFQAVSPVLPLITDDYGIGHTAASLLVGAVLIISGVFGMPGGFLVGRLGVRKSFTAAWFMVGAVALSALSTGFEALLAMRIVYGLGMVAITAATGPLIMNWFRPRELPVVTSLAVAAMTVGMVVSAAAVAPLAGPLGWEGALSVMGAVGLAGAFAWLVWGRIRDEEGRESPPVNWGDIKAVLRNRTVQTLGLADASCFSMYIALSSWLPTYYHETRGMSLTEAGFLLSLLPFMGIFAVLLGGFLRLRVSRKRLFFIVPGVLAALGAQGAFLIDNTVVTYISVMLLGFGAWLYVPTLLTLPMELAGMTPHRVALAWGWIATVSGVGGFLSPLVVGALKDTVDSFVPGFIIFSVLAWFLVVAGFLLPRTDPHGAERQDPSPSAAPAQE